MVQYIELREISFYAHHGISKEERKVGTTYIVNIKIFFEDQKSFHTDILEDSINYVTIYEIIKKEIVIPSNLIENVAYRIISKLRKSFTKISNIELRLSKQNPFFGDGNIREVAVHLAD